MPDRREPAASPEPDPLRHEHERLRLTNEILRAMLRATNEGEVLQAVATQLGDALGADRAAVMLLGEGRDKLRIIASAEDPALKEMAVDLRRYPEIRRSLEEGVTVFVRDARADPTFSDLRPLIDRLDIRQVAVVPIRWESVVLGTLFLRTRGHATLTPVSVKFCEEVAALTAEALYHAYRREQATRGEPYRRLLGFLRRLADELSRGPAPADPEWARQVADLASRIRAAIESPNRGG